MSGRRKAAMVLALTMVVLAACSGGGGGGGGGKDPVASGLTANFVSDADPTCPGSSDSLALRKGAALGSSLTIGLSVADCDQSLGIYGVNFEIAFDPAVIQCASSNPCAAGSVLGAPLLTSSPVCSCDNRAGRILGSFTKQAPGTNDTVGSGGIEDIVEISMKATAQGIGRIDFVSTGSINGTALITMTGSGPTAVGGLTYVGGAAISQ